jgi:hypothetical protein
MQKYTQKPIKRKTSQPFLRPKLSSFSFPSRLLHQKNKTAPACSLISAKVKPEYSSFLYYFRHRERFEYISHPPAFKHPFARLKLKDIKKAAFT